MRILVSGDWHIDGARIGKTNPETDLDLRVEDFLKTIDKMIAAIEEHSVDLFVMNGDLFKGRTSTHHIETIVAEKFKQIAAQVPLIINLGNHDYTPKQLSYNTHTYSILERLNIPNITINLDFNLVHLSDCNLVLYPYYDLKRLRQFKNNEELINHFTDQINQLSLPSEKTNIFIGHGTPAGTVFHEDFYFDLDMIEEPVLPTKWFDKFDIALFSHIHKAQWIGDKIFHIGSPERVDFSEATQDKGFVIYDSQTKKTEWYSTKPRPMYDIKINLLEITEWEDPTQAVISQIDTIEDIGNAMLKIQVECRTDTLAEIDQLEIKGRLQKALYSKPIKFITPRRQKTRMHQVTEQLSPEQALDEVLKMREDLSEENKKLFKTKARIIMAMGQE